MSKQTSTIIPLDTVQTHYKKLTEYAARITTLFEHPIINTDTDAKGCLDELLGSVYSLALAFLGGFENRYTPKEDAVILKRAKDLANGSIRIDGKWMAGYHMNSSTYRTASVHHRLLKIITNGHDKMEMDELDGLAGKLYKQWTKQSWKRTELKLVHDEANHLKHTKEGIYSKRHISDHYAVIAIDQLLAITEEWVKQSTK